MNDKKKTAGELLIALLSGELAEDDPEVQSAFREEPELREEWTRMRAVAGRLDQAGLEQDRILSTNEPVPELASDIVTREIARLAIEEPKGGAPPARQLGARRIWPWLLVAAAVVVAIPLARNWLGREANGPPPRFLGNDAVELLAPVGGGASFDVFRWEAQLRPGGYYRILLFDGAAGPDAEPFFESERLTERTWSPPTDIAWPERLRWELVLFEADGQELDFSSAEAWRSP